MIKKKAVTPFFRDKKRRKNDAFGHASVTLSSLDICLISETVNSKTSDFESDDKFIPIKLKIWKR